MLLLTRETRFHNNYEFYLQFTVGYQINRRPRNIVFTSSESNAPTEALSKMSDEFTITAGGTAPPFQKIGGDSNSGGTYFIQFTLAPKVRGLEDVSSIGDHIFINSNGNVGIGMNNPSCSLHIEGSSIKTGIFSERLWLNAIGDNSGIGTPDDNTGSPWYGLGIDDLAWNNQSFRYSGDIPILSGFSGVALRSGSGNLILNGSGYVGIGATNPTVPLFVNGSAGNTGAVRYFNYSGLSGQNQYLTSISIQTSNGILSGDYVAVASDRRVKENIVDVDDDSALTTLRMLKPKKYNYRDRVVKGDDPVWGFIAQEVRETLPHSTVLQRKVIPNIYEVGVVSSSNVITFSNFNTSNLESNATCIEVRTVTDGTKEIHLAEVIDEHTIRVEEDLSAWTGSVDEDGNVIEGDQIFVYGEEVKDFVFLKKDAIWTVATSALQEVDRQLQAEKQKVADLLARVEALESR